MSKKLKITSSRKEFIKSNFDNINPDNLPKPERLYYARVKGGKNRYQSAPKIDGKFIPTNTEAYKLIEAIAKDQGITPARYVEQNESEVRDFLTEKEAITSKDINEIPEIISRLSTKTVNIETDKGIKRVSKAKAIEAVAMLSNYAFSLGEFAYIALKVKVTGSGKVIIQGVPDPSRYETPEGRARAKSKKKGRKKQQENDLEILLEALDSADIDYVISGKE